MSTQGYMQADGDDQRVEAAKAHIVELNAQQPVEKETESEVERVEATKELNQFIENSAEKVESDNTRIRLFVVKRPLWGIEDEKAIKLSIEGANLCFLG